MKRFTHIPYRELSPNSAVHISSTKHFSVFQETVLALQSATLLFWFTHIDIPAQHQTEDRQG